MQRTVENGNDGNVTKDRFAGDRILMLSVHDYSTE